MASPACRGFKRKGARVLGHNIITAPNLPLKGLKRCSGTFGSISDLNGGSLQWSRWWKYCSLARHHTNLKNPHTNRFCMVTPIVSSKYRQIHQFSNVKVASDNQYVNSVLLDDPGRVRRTTHGRLKIPPNAPDCLVTSHTPLVQSSWAEPKGDKINLHDFPGR